MRFVSALIIALLAVGAAPTPATVNQQPEERADAGASLGERLPRTDQRAIRAAILHYLHSRYDSRLLVATGSTNTNMPSERAPVAQVEGTAVAIAFDELQANIAESLGGWGDYQLHPRFSDIAVDDHRARATVTLNVDYHYATAPDVDSSIYGVVYQFELINENGAWAIVAIDFDDREYQDFKAEVADVTNLGASTHEAARQLLDERAVDSRVIDQLMQFTSVPADDTTERIEANAVESYSYKAANGAEYVRRFGSSGSAWFYNTELDCTNFASQGVWAAYGGYVSGDDKRSKQNIKDKVRMVPNVWHAGTGGGMSKWESVGKFWDYVTSSKTTGPKAKGYNNNSKWDNLSPTSIKVGDVLQFRRSNDSSKPYVHSIYVSKVFQGPPGRGETYWDLIYYSSHSNNYSSRKLTEALKWCESKCNMRRLAFSSANFAK